MRNQIELIESRPAVLDITDAEAKSLLMIGERLSAKTESESESSSTPNIVNCVPAGSGWKVTVSNVVGVISLGDLQLEIQPKIPVDHLVYLLQRANAIPRSLPEIIRASPNPTFLELVARWFNTELYNVIRADPIKDYRQTTGQLKTLRGRLQTLPTAREYYSGKQLLVCDYEEFDADTPPNRVLKAAARAVANQVSFDVSVRTESRRLARQFYDVGEVQVGDDRYLPDTRMRHYGAAHVLALQILKGHGTFPTPGGHFAKALVFHTPVPVEDGIRNILKTGLAPQHSVSKRRIPVQGLVRGVNPDLVFDSGAAVGDIKYKSDRGELSRSDLYQSVAFAVALGAGSAFVIEFGAGAPDLSPIRIGNIVVDRLLWRNDIPPEGAASQLVVGTVSLLTQQSDLVGAWG